MIKNTLYLFGLMIVFSSCNKTDSDNNCVAIVNEDCICTMQYDPVCGCDDVSYSNQCAANCAGVDVVSQGECP